MYENVQSGFLNLDAVIPLGTVPLRLVFTMSVMPIADRNRKLRWCSAAIRN